MNEIKHLKHFTGDTWNKFAMKNIKVEHNVPWWPAGDYAGSTSSIVIDPHNSSNAYLTDWFGTYFTNNLKSSQPVWATRELGHEEVVVLALSSHPNVPLLRYYYLIISFLN